MRQAADFYKNYDGWKDNPGKEDGVMITKADIWRVMEDYHQYQLKLLNIDSVSGSSLSEILKAQPDFKLANEIKEVQAEEVFNYIVNEHDVKLTYEEWRKTVKTYYR